MNFVSAEFLLFLAVLTALYYLIPKRGQWLLLLVGSLLFYAAAGWRFLIFLVVTATTVWFAARRIDEIGAAGAAWLKEHKAELSPEEKKAKKAAVKKRQHGVFLAGLLLNLGILAVLKYTNFVIANVNSLLSALQARTLAGVDLILPLGISFYTFQAVGYLIDVNRGKVKAERNYLRFLLFVGFFPQLVQGPISRFDQLSETLYGPHDLDWQNISHGLRRIVWGYFKKVVVADRILTAVLTITGKPETYSGAMVLVGMLFYAIELYADFTGGIDISIGAAEMLGIRLAENFDRPYLSRSVEEYWRRWHITMGTWFRDYIFYPLSVSKGMLKLSKWSRQHLGNGFGKRLSVYVSTTIVWFATGIWHGAAWNFVVWGLLNGFAIIISQELTPFYDWFHKHVPVEGKPGWAVFQTVRTFFLMCLFRSLDCYRDVPLTFRMWWSILAKGNFSALTDGTLLKLGLTGADYLVIALGVALMLTVSLLAGKKPVRQRLDEAPALVRSLGTALMILVILVFGAYGIGYDASAFIYGQF